MVKILIGVPWHKPHSSFLESLPRFLDECSLKYDITFMAVVGKTLVDAQNALANFFLTNDFDYLLLCEDDHAGQSVEALDALVSSGYLVSAVNYFSRHFPFQSCMMRDLHNGKPSERFSGITAESGFKQCDLCGFGMMLISKLVFDKLEQPYFRLNKYGGDGSYATDIDFCDRLAEVGIKPMATFDYCLSHRDVTKENIQELRYKGIQEIRSKQLKEKGYIC